MIENDTIFLSHQKLTQIPPIPSHKTQIILFRNLIQEITPLPNHIISIDLSDNRIVKIQNLENQSSLKILDLSYNLIHSIENIQNLNNLRELYLNCNNISRMENLNVNLFKLDLSCNDICKIEDLENVTKLRELYLANNKIKEVSNLKFLKDLKVLGLQNNLIVSLDCANLPEGLETLLLNECVMLEEIKNIEMLGKLECIDIAKTKVCKVNVSEHVVVYEN